MLQDEDSGHTMTATTTPVSPSDIGKSGTKNLSVCQQIEGKLKEKNEVIKQLNARIKSLEESLREKDYTRSQIIIAEEEHKEEEEEKTGHTGVSSSGNPTGDQDNQDFEGAFIKC